MKICSYFALFILLFSFTFISNVTEIALFIFILFLQSGHVKKKKQSPDIPLIVIT